MHVSHFIAEHPPPEGSKYVLSAEHDFKLTLLRLVKYTYMYLFLFGIAVANSGLNNLRAGFFFYAITFANAIEIESITCTILWVKI